MDLAQEKAKPHRKASCQPERTLDVTTQIVSQIRKNSSELSTNPDPKAKVFIAHGSNELFKSQVQNLMAKLKVEATVLHEQPNGGKTIIEKFEAESNRCNFAVVLMTADDVGGKDKDSLQPRARQNVVAECFYFAGRLGRSKVAVLKEPDVEVPSDLAGVVYLPLDKDWRLPLSRELKTAGFEIDLNLLH